MNTKLVEESQNSELLREITKLNLSPGEILLGTLASIDEDGSPRVTFTFVDNAISAVAISTSPITPQHIGRQVALLFANGDYQKPVIAGFVHSPLRHLLESFEFQSSSDVPNDDSDINVFPDSEFVNQIDRGKESDVVKVDGKRVLLEGHEEVVLKCGDSSITLTKAGKIIIRGKYLLSRSSGVNRILGGSVQVN